MKIYEMADDGSVTWFDGLEDIERMAKAMENRWRLVHDFPDGSRLSTVFLAIDHNHWGVGDPVLWESLFFGGILDEHMYRYQSKAEAVAGHRDLIIHVEQFAHCLAKRMSWRRAKAYMDITNRDRARYNKALRHRGEWGKTYERL